jgi:hypothetical protein
MRDKVPELWLGHLVSPIGCMSSIGVSDPVNVHNRQKEDLVNLTTSSDNGNKWELVTDDPL